MNLTYFLLNSIKYAKYTLSKNLIFLMCYHFILDLPNTQSTTNTNYVV